MTKHFILRATFVLACLSLMAALTARANGLAGSKAERAIAAQSYQTSVPAITKSAGQSAAQSAAKANSIVAKTRATPAKQPAAPINAANKQTQADITYTVKKGDTLYGIAKLFGTSVELLQTKNHINEPRLLQIGTVLHIPGAKTFESIPAIDEKTSVVKVLQATLTAYTAGVESTGKRPGHPLYGITASGTHAQEGRTIAVDPKVIPIGTKVYIEGIGFRTAEDTGSAIKGAKIDVFMNDVKQARKFGVKKNRKVYVLSEDEKKIM
ncbi:MAG TPA: 3D domain-containing protein [Bacilli bacterium]